MSWGPLVAGECMAFLPGRHPEQGPGRAGVHVCSEAPRGREEDLPEGRGALGQVVAVDRGERVRRPRWDRRRTGPRLRAPFLGSITWPDAAQGGAALGLGGGSEDLERLLDGKGPGEPRFRHVADARK